MKITAAFRLDNKEYREFVRWYNKIFLKKKEAGWISGCFIPPFLSCMRRRG